MAKEKMKTNFNDGMNTVAVKELGKMVSKEPEEKKFQFTKQAFYRVVLSYFPKELRDHFEGQHDVDLDEVEWQILAFEKNGKRKNLKADGVEVGSLAECEMGISHQCQKEFLPKSWTAKSGKAAGHYTPDLRDAVILFCTPCREMLRTDIEVFNQKVKEGERKIFPRFLPREEAEAALERRRKAIAFKQEREGRVEDALSHLPTKAEILRSIQKKHRR